MNTHVPLRKIRMKTMVLCALALVVSSCAKQPGQIAATPGATYPYLQLSCAELVADRAAKRVTQQRLEAAQHEAAERDKGAMTVIHIPIAAMTGQNREDDVARGKGELEALDAAIQSKSCT
jgi:ribosomal protein L16/L10AE